MNANIPIVFEEVLFSAPVLAGDRLVECEVDFELVCAAQHEHLMAQVPSFVG